MKATDSSLCKISVTDKAGKFSFQNIPFGNYYVNASAINFTKLDSKVFELKTVWNGTYNNAPLPVATYYYIIDTKSKLKVLSGSITILR